MNTELHEKSFENFCCLLNRVERTWQTSRNQLKKSGSHGRVNSERHDITIAISTMRCFVNAVQKWVNANKGKGVGEDLPIFLMMNEMMLNQQKFRDAITRLMGTFYGYSSSKIPQENVEIVLLGQLVELLAVYIRKARQETLLSEDEMFCNTIALMKINRILQLKDLNVSEMNTYHDFSIEPSPGLGSTTIEGSVASVNTSREAQQVAVKIMRIIKKSRSEIKKLQVALRTFSESFTEVLFTRLDFALHWKQVLANEEYGYAVESYAEKCRKELERFTTKSGNFFNASNQLEVIDAMLSKLESKMAHTSTDSLEKFTVLSEEIHGILDQITAMCLRESQFMYGDLIGEANIRKFQEAKTHMSTLHVSESVIISSHSKKNSISAFAVKHGLPKMAKVADKLGFGHEESRSLRPSSTRKMGMRHRDIVDEYDFAFTQTMQMLENQQKCEY